MNQPSILTRFFWFCSGANPDILTVCPRSEHIKFVGVGGTVFFTGLLAALSGGYAFFTVFGSVFAASIFGGLWGLIIFNLDRFIVSTIKKEGGIGRQFVLALPRFLLAMVLAIVISKPLELRIFQAEITEILTDQKLERLAAIELGYQEKLAALEADIATLKSETAQSLQRRETDYQDYKCECDGTCGTGKRGRGSECERKEAKYLQSNREYQELKAVNEQEMANLHSEMTAVKTDRLAGRELAEDTFATGLMARLKASNELPFGPSFFLTLLIMLIEISPILAKLLAPRGPYDEMLKKVEHQFYLDQLQAIKERKLAMNSRVDLLANIHKAEVEQKVEQKKATMRAVTDAHMEMVREQISDWLKKEKAKRKE
ncbi:MAG: DUF4407 domain-containing protein [Bacteroidota bacterium]